jgi:rare lipoprotein A (peptidoglycan hydrolase)
MFIKRLAQLGTYFACGTAVLACLPVRTLRAPVGPGSNPTLASVFARQTVTPKPVRAWTTVATWYGDEFSGQETANGETFNMYGMTAAHPTLPLGSLIRIIYPKTGRSLIVRINDRGPYVEGRGLDVSYGVARALGFVKEGLARVRVQLLEVPSHWSEKITLN